MQPQATSDGDTTHLTPGTESPLAPPNGAAGEAQGGFAVTATLEPAPHPSTKPEVTTLKDPEVKDFGWNSEPKAVPSPLIHGVTNDDLYILIRRFNKQIFHVKAVEDVTGLLDLEVSENEEFSPDKLRATLERLYMTVIVGISAFAKHISRLRSWNEPRRTAGFTLAYFVAWWFNIILPTCLITLVVLILDPPTRKLLFPPAPLSIISATSGNLQQPKAGTVGSKDSLSGAPEAHKGEAVEQEAQHFVSVLGSVAVSTAVGKGPGEDGNGNAVGGGEAESEAVDKPASSIEGAAPDPTNITAESVAAQNVASGDTPMDPVKVPVEEAMWAKARPVMRAVNNISDTWERFANALSPTRPFPYWEPRLKLACPMIPAAIILYFIRMAVVLRMTTFIAGCIFFGQPFLVRGLRKLTHRVPHWRQYLELRRTILAGVPTNAQLTITLLRLAEQNKAPLPPPPTSMQSTDSDSADETEEFDASSYDVESDSDDYAGSMEIEQDDTNTDGPKKRKPGRKIIGALKRTVKAGVGGALGVDHLKAKVGSEPAKQRVGAVTTPPPTATIQQDSSNSGKKMESMVSSEELPDAARVNLPGGEGPCIFSARLHGKKGHVVIVNSATSPCVGFAYSKISKSLLASLVPGRHTNLEETEVDLHPEFSMAIADIVELRKMGGYGWKSKLVIGWATGREVLDGLELVDSKGEKIVLTAIKGRDELFNRLISMNGHKWESL